MLEEIASFFANKAHGMTLNTFSDIKSILAIPNSNACSLLTVGISIRLDNVFARRPAFPSNQLR